MCEKGVSKIRSVLKYCLNRYKNQKKGYKALYDCLSALKFVSDWIFTNKMIQDLHEALFANDDVLFFNEYFGKATPFMVKWIFLV